MLNDTSAAQSGSGNTEASQTPEATYQQRCQQFEQQRARYHHYSDLNANINVALVISALLMLSLGIWLGGTPFFILAGLFALGFIAAYINLGRINLLEERYQTLWTINDEGLHRLRRDWAKLPLRQPPPTDLGHPYAADLDLLGHASLQHLLGTPNTPIGQATLQQWLLHPAPPAVAAQRQAAAAELAAQIEFRDTFALSGRLMGKAEPTYERFLEWAEGDSWLAQRPVITWLSRLFPILTLVSAWPATQRTDALSLLDTLLVCQPDHARALSAPGERRHRRRGRAPAYLSRLCRTVSAHQRASMDLARPATASVRSYC